MSAGTTFETIDFDEEKNSKRPDDLAGAFVGFFSSLNYKLLFFLFLIFIFVTSDVFLDKFLSRLNGTVEHRTTTTKGTFIQAFLLVFLYILADLIIRLGLI